MKSFLQKNLSDALLKKCKKMRQPNFIQPMLATLTNDYFSSKDWLYEHKFDGVRCLAFKKNGNVILMSRNHNRMNISYPEIAQALEEQKADNFIIDGEIVALHGGISNFELLQSRIHLEDVERIKTREKQIPVAYCIFDLLYVDGHDVRDLPLIARKELLKKLFKYTHVLLYSQHLVGDGVKFFHAACKAKWEGIMAKKADSHYVDKRSRNWLKFKCISEQELVIGGYTAPRGTRSDFGALLVGYYKKGKFHYAGKVGTGYDQETLHMLGKKLRSLEIKKCPFVDFDISPRGVHWVKPQLVAEFQFAQWTQGGKLRVGRYKGLRTDKAAKDVVKEVPKHLPGIKK